MAEKQTEVWTYAGRRRGAKRALVHVWVDQNGRELVYGKLSASATGGRYSVDVERDGENVVVYPSTLAYTGERSTDTEQRAAWQAEERVEMAAVERGRMERKAASDDDLAEALAPVKRLYQKQRTRAQRTAFLAMLLDELAYKG